MEYLKPIHKECIIHYSLLKKACIIPHLRSTLLIFLSEMTSVIWVTHPELYSDIAGTLAAATD